MILDKKATLKSKTTIYDDESMPSESWTANDTAISVNIQPNDGSGYFMKDVSNFQDNEQYIIFTRVNTLVAVGKRIECDNETYEINRVKRWNMHYECLCSLV